MVRPKGIAGLTTLADCKTDSYIQVINSLSADGKGPDFKSHDLTQLQKSMNHELKKVKKWLDANRSVLNIDKTNFVVFHSPCIKIPKPIIIRFGRKKIKHESCVKFLGILLDKNLSWKFHINV